MSQRLRAARSLSLPLLLALLLAAAPFLAQTSRGTVSGTVTDPQGAVIAGATAELHHRETNQTRSTVTNEEGLYRFEAVDLGTYDLTVKAGGFKAYIKRELPIIANRITNVDAALELGEQQSVIEVSASVGEILQKSDPVRGGNFAQREIVMLPLTNLDPVVAGSDPSGCNSAQRHYQQWGHQQLDQWRGRRAVRDQRTANPRQQFSSGWNRQQ